jgi:hypothetical protein
MSDLTTSKHDRREASADNTEKRWTDRDVLALMRATTAPAYVHDRVYGIIRESRKPSIENRH